MENFETVRESVLKVCKNALKIKNCAKSSVCLKKCVKS